MIGESNIFSDRDFCVQKIKAYFMDEQSVLGILKRKGFAITWFERSAFDDGARFCAYRDNNASTLVVAHLDSVMPPITVLARGGRIYSPAVDNRIGVYIAVDLLQRKGIRSDVLITTDEEIGFSSARCFAPLKRYNWCYSFDRMGDDVVLYQYGSDAEWRVALSRTGFRIGEGSYSDIADLGHLGCCCVNFGIGYGENHHSYDAYADVSVMTRQLNGFNEFWSDNRERRFPYSRPRGFGRVRMESYY